METVARNLYCSSGVTTRPVPHWANFYLALGSLVARRADARTQCVVGLAIPTRAYAAVLTATGVVTTRSRIPTRPVRAAEYFEWLCELPIDTPVTVRRANKIWKGLLCGCRTSSSGDLIGVQQQSNLTCWFPPKSSLNIQVTPENIRKLPKKQKGRPVVAVAELAEQNRFVSHLLPEGSDWQEFTTYSRLDCALLGTMSLLREEARETTFGAKSPNGDLVEGTLQDVLRVREFAGANQNYRSQVFSVTNRKLPGTAGGLRPAVAVFDGAAGFLKWREDLRKSDWIVLLDRTERYFDDAVAVLHEEYINRVDGDGLEAPGHVPPGVELISFEEARG